MKEKKKVRIEEFVYMLIVICVVVFLFYSDCMDKYLYTLDAVKIVKNCLYIFLGGGTVIDAAKTIGMLAVNGGNVEEYQMEGRQVKTVPPLFIAVPTTSGTGAEATKTSVVTTIIMV